MRQKTSCEKEYVSHSSKDRNRAGHARIYARGHCVRPRRRADGAAVDETNPLPSGRGMSIASCLVEKRLKESMIRDITCCGGIKADET